MGVSSYPSVTVFRTSAVVSHLYLMWINCIPRRMSSYLARINPPMLNMLPTNRDTKQEVVEGTDTENSLTIDSQN